MSALTFQLLVDGQPLDEDTIGAIESIEVEDHAELADAARVRFAISLAGKSDGWTVLDQRICERLAPIELGVRLGGDAISTLLRGYVVDVRAELGPEPGRSSVEIVAMDPTVLMDLEEKVKAWPDRADSAIAQSIFSDHGFDADVDDTGRARAEREMTTMQRGTDIRFLQQLARRNGYECYVEPGASGGTPVGHFHAPRLEQQPQAVLTVGTGTDANFEHVKLRHDLLGATTARAKGVDDRQTQAKAEDADVQGSERRALGRQAAESGDHPRVRLLSQTGLTTTDELRTLAQSVVDRSAFELRAEGNVNIAALPQVLRAKVPVNVRGLGQRYSGQWYVERVLHRIVGTSYEQRLALKRNATGLTRQERFQEDDALPPTPAVRT